MKTYHGHLGIRDQVARTGKSRHQLAEWKLGDEAIESAFLQDTSLSHCSWGSGSGEIYYFVSPFLNGMFNKAQISKPQTIIVYIMLGDK